MCIRDRNTREIIRRDRNHPSVLMWEPILNETRYPKAVSYTHLRKESQVNAFHRLRINIDNFASTGKIEVTMMRGGDELRLHHRCV